MEKKSQWQLFLQSMQVELSLPQKWEPWEKWWFTIILISGLLILGYFFWEHNF